MQEKVLSLDIQRTIAPEIDISGFFPLSETHAIDALSHKKPIDDMRMYRNTPNLAPRLRVQLARFVTVETLDIGIPSIMDVRRFSYQYQNYPTRPPLINLMPPLEYIPYGALDLRMGRVIRKKKVYPDLFSRKLPRSLQLRRTYQHTHAYLRSKKRSILFVLATFLAISIPLVFYIKYTVEHGYQELLNLRYASSITDIQDRIASARSDFDRARFLFLPFSWLPGDTIDLVNRATR